MCVCVCLMPMMTVGSLTETLRCVGVRVCVCVSDAKDDSGESDGDTQVCGCISEVAKSCTWIEL